jgi:hypothetical protein
MARKEGTGERFDRKERVVATVAMPGIPEGTQGKVVFVEGFRWTRYWVRFENGVVRGSLDRKRLARPSEWLEIQRRREAGEDDVAADAGAAAAATGSGGTEAASGETISVNGVPVPAHLIERSKNRREVLGVA